MDNINVLPRISSTTISNTETSSPLTPFSAVASHFMVPFSKIQVQITLETIYEEEEEEDENETEKSSDSDMPTSSSPPILPIQAAACSFEMTGFFLFLVSFGYNYQRA
ncbi:unnamed protein product [Sphenostylis stenocarpa]|uniref:Uncharacterized protein n=1 Tax=Sphenostylis stenocarpa TaxID=92480 RepID=A0AA86S618_9FABA|nr:unnamed protein product [Sphenostylis stenocarpa]